MKTRRSTRARSYPAHPALRQQTWSTPAGPLTVANDGDHVCGVRFGRRGEAADERRPRTTPLEREIARQVRAYLAGRLRAFDLPLRLSTPPFTARILAEVEAIPYGETRGYGEIAARLGKPNAARAVGQAVGSNPLGLFIPCHRVLAAGARIGGFGGGLAWKKYLLGIEGATYVE